MTEIAIVISALILDMLFGGRRLIGGLFDIDQVPRILIGWAEPKLNREWRSPTTLVLRGLLFLVLIIALFWGVGMALDYIFYQFVFGDWLVVATLFLLLRQRVRLDAVLAFRKADPEEQDGEDPYRGPRLALQQLYDGFFSHLCVMGLVFLWQGLPAVFALRGVTILVDKFFEQDARREITPFYLIIVPLYNIATLLPAVLSTFCLLVTGLLIARKGEKQQHGFPGLLWGALWGRDWALWAVTRVLGYSFYLGPDDGWSGNAGARARLRDKDMTRGAYLYVISWLIIVGLCAVQIPF